MRRRCLAAVVVAFIGVAFPMGAKAQVTYAKDWSYNQRKDYFSKKCSFPAGGYQYLVYDKSQPKWVYWYNPGTQTQVYWCACPTVNHPKWGQNIRVGEDLFLKASTMSKNIEDTKFPDDANGANFKKGTAKDKDGSPVDLN